MEEVGKKRWGDGWACKVGYKKKEMGGPRSTPKRLRLVMVDGSFFTPGDDGVAMDAEVWSRLPAELIWEVLRFVPAAAHFRLQSVSRNWRQVLTSAAFRDALPSRPSEEQQRVVACVTRASETVCDNQRGTSSRPTVDVGRKKVTIASRLKVVDIDLSSMVPSPFRNPDSSYVFSVVAAADGLVCVSIAGGEPNRTWYCVLNPLTRTCKVLPPVPFKPLQWLPPTPTALTMVGYLTRDGERDGEVHVATCDLAAGGGGGGGGLKWDLGAYKSGEGWSSPWINTPVVAVCGGETYWYRQYQVRVMVPHPGGSGRMVELVALDEPPEVPPAAGTNRHARRSRLRFDGWRVQLVVRGGAVFMLRSLDGRPRGVGVWRLARAGAAGRLQWEAVARLDMAELERLTGLECISFVLLGPACAARELLCCNVTVGMRTRVRSVVLALNPDTGEWKLLLDEFRFAQPLELRPDLYL